jgi:hypothetical protein
VVTTKLARFGPKRIIPRSHLRRFLRHQAESSSRIKGGGVDFREREVRRKKPILRMKALPKIKKKGQAILNLSFLRVDFYSFFYPIVKMWHGVKRGARNGVVHYRLVGSLVS